MNKIIWVDTETTGTDPNRHGLIQFAAIIEIGGEDVANINLHIKTFPTDEIDPKAMEITGTTREQLSTFMRPEAAWPVIMKELEKHVNKFNKLDKFTFAGFNAGFDLNMIHAFAKKCGDNYCGSWFWYPPLDVAIIAGEKLRHVRHELKNFRLGTVAEYLGINAEGDLHDAMTDIRITREVYRKIKGE